MILYAITNTLYNLFGDSISIYTNSTVQNMKAPCFFVHEINAIGMDFTRKRKGLRHTYEIVYVSDTDRINGLNEEIAKVTEKLLVEFEFLMYEGETYKAINKVCSRIDNDLHLTFGVFETFRDKKESTMMEKLEMKWK